jgi:RecB family endonuclease NucS
MRLVIAQCSVDYAGRLAAHLPSAKRLLIHKADGSVLVHSDGGSYKPLNWMSPPCTVKEEPGLWTVTNKAGETLQIRLEEVFHDSAHELGVDPGLRKDGVESHLQELLAAQIERLGQGYRLIRREYPTAIGPVDIMCREPESATVTVEIERAAGEAEGAERAQAADSAGAGAAKRAKHWAVEIKRRATIDAVEQLTRYLELLNRDPLLAPVGGVLAAQQIAPQARTLAEDRGMRCVILDYDAMRGIEPEGTLF